MIKPTLEQVFIYCDGRRNGIDPQAFIDYNDSVGWMVGKKPMKDWQAAIRTWERRIKNPGSALSRLTDRSWA